MRERVDGDERALGGTPFREGTPSGKVAVWRTSVGGTTGEHGSVRVTSQSQPCYPPTHGEASSSGTTFTYFLKNLPPTRCSLPARSRTIIW